jgi:anti-sigma factor RsiW
MAERLNGMHPDAAELQAHADGEVMDERVTAHVASCAECRAEIVAIRRVTAALSLGSRPPDSLTDKIRARRAEAAQGAPMIPVRWTSW